MPAESAILAHAPELAPPLIAGLLSGESGALPGLGKAFRLAEASALLSLCEESLWEDFALMPALRDDFLGDELAGLGRKVLQPDGRIVRQLRDRLSPEVARLRKTDGSSDEFASLDLSAADPPPSIAAATRRYLEALALWTAPVPLPEALKQRVSENWYSRFGAALNKAVEDDERLGAGIQATPSPEDRRFDELNRQSWRLDEILGKLDKWVQANPGAVRDGSVSVAKRSSSGVPTAETARRYVRVGAMALAAVATLILAFWIALGSSPKVESLVARAQAGRLTGVSERLVHAASWMDASPIPREVFTSGFSALQDAGDAATELTADELDAAFLDLQRKQLCRAIPRGWVFHEQVRHEYRTANAAGQDWWRRALLMLIEAAPDDEESPESVERWRLLLPHLIALFESAPKSALTEPPMQTLLSALSRGLLASRIEPGRRPALSPDSQEPDELYKRISVFVEEANKSLEEGVKLIEAKYGRFSNEMATAHRLLAELSWRTRALKKEQDSWVRASRALDKQEQRDATEIAFCDVRLGISRAIASDHDGAEEAFVEALKVLSEQLGPTHPQIGRLQRKIARVYADLGQFDQAWAHHQQALDVLMKSYPAPTPEIADLLEEQAQFLIDYRDFAKGIGLLKRGIEVRQKIEYPTSPELARAYGTLADAQALQGEMAEAEQSARTRLGLLEKEYGPSSIAVRDAQIDLVMLLLDSGNPAKAGEAIALLQPHVTLPLDAPFVDSGAMALGRCLYARALVQSNQTPEAIAQFDRGIRVLLNTQPRPSLVVAGCLRDYGEALAGTPRRLDGIKFLNDAEAELSALGRMRPRYLRITSQQIEDIRQRISKAQQ